MDCRLPCASTVLMLTCCESLIFRIPAKLNTSLVEPRPVDEVLMASIPHVAGAHPEVAGQGYATARQLLPPRLPSCRSAAPPTKFTRMSVAGLVVRAMDLPLLADTAVSPAAWRVVF